MRRLSRLLLGVAFLVSFVAPMPALAVSNTNVFDGACTNVAARGSAVCQNGQTTTDPLTGSNGLIVKITRIIAYAAGIVAVIIIMLSGLRYINSNGDPQKASAARNGIIYALVGLIVIISASFIISLVMSKIKL